MQNKSKSLKSFGLLFALAGLMVMVSAGFAYTTKANVIIQRLIAGNAAPVMDEVIVASIEDGPQVDEVTLTEKIDTDLYVHGSFTDLNGCRDAKRVDVVVHRADVGADCQADPLNCYHASADVFTSCTASDDTTGEFEAEVALQSFANPTDAGSVNEDTYWIAQATIVDKDDVTDSAESDSFEVISLAALGVTANLDFGTLQLSEVSEPRVIYMANYGNRTVVPYCVAEANFACSGGEVGVIEASQLRMNSRAQVEKYLTPIRDNLISGSDSLTSANTFTDSLTSDVDIDLTPEQDEELWEQGLAMEADVTQSYYDGIPPGPDSDESILPIYFTLKVPPSGVEGACTTIMRVTAVAQ